MMWPYTCNRVEGRWAMIIAHEYIHVESAIHAIQHMLERDSRFALLYTNALIEW